MTTKSIKTAAKSHKHTATKTTKKVPHPFRAHHKPELTLDENEELGVPQLDLDMARQALSTVSEDEIKVLQHAGLKVPGDVAEARKAFATYTQSQVQHLFYVGGKGVDTCPDELKEASDTLGIRLCACMANSAGPDLSAMLQAILNGGVSPDSDDRGEEPPAADADGDEDESDEMEKELVAALMGEDGADEPTGERKVARSADQDNNF